MPPHTLELRAEPRAVFGKHVRRLRRQGIVPANIYGHGDPRPIQAPIRAMEYLLVHGGRTGVVTIEFDGRSEMALLKDIQRDPRSNQILHIEFQAVSMEESVTSTVPIRFVGESAAVTKWGGILSHPMTSLRVTARAVDLPESIEVDLSALVSVDDAIHVSDLPESASYKLIDPPEGVLAMVAPAKAAEVAEPVAAESAAPEPEAQTE
jgi:large subunit ribosomal protein L25